MKTQLLFILILILFVGCGDDILLSPANQSTYREVAYNSLDENSKASITINWKDAKVEDGKYIKEGERHILKLSSGEEIPFLLSNGIIMIKNHRLVAVTFNTINDPLLGPIIIIVDPGQIKVVGIVGRM